MRRLHHFLVLASLLFTLSGCIKTRLALDINPNGSGTIAAGVGMTKEAQALAESEGTSVVDDLSEELDTESHEGEAVTVRRWSEGEYDWVEGSRSFDDLDELNQILADNELFRNFSVTRHRSLFFDRFVLRATAPALLDDLEFEDELFIDPSGWLEFQLAVDLPGTIIETNGVYDDNSTMIWTIDSREELNISATSRIWAWGRSALLGFEFMLLIAFGSISIGAFRLHLNSRKER